MTNKELQEILYQYPDNAEIKVAVHREAPSYTYSVFDELNERRIRAFINGNNDVIFLGEVRDA